MYLSYNITSLTFDLLSPATHSKTPLYKQLTYGLAIKRHLLVKIKDHKNLKMMHKDAQNMQQ